MLAVIVEVVKRLIGDIWKALFIVFFVLTLSVSYISYQNTYYGAFPTQKIYAWDERINFSISCDRTYSFQPEDNIAMCELESDSDIPVNISYFIVDRQENQEFKNISIRPKDAMVSTVQKEFFIIGTGEAGLHKFYIAISFNKGPASESLTKEYDIFEKFMSIRVYTEEEIAEKQKEKLALLSVLVSVVFAAFSTGLYNLKKIWENK